MYAINSIIHLQGHKKISPYFVPQILINLAAGNIALKYGYQGLNHAVSTACTTGAHSIGDAMRFIQYGDIDVCIAGGSEASTSPLAMSAFSKAKSLSVKFNESPSEASRPFDKQRDGFVLGEGAGILVLEEYEHAMKRNVKIYAEIIGYGLTCDANHITAPPPNGEGAERSMRRALQVADISPEQVGYINAHATSTELGDLAEARAIHQVFGENVLVSSTKGACGHLLGAAGCVEAIFTILALHHQTVPPTLNLLDPLDSVKLNHVALEAKKVHDLNYALTNSFGFGGTNASLIFKKTH
jgi:3-oxoacyl-[acyl-carrier-protein] synthase II